jgi:regulator of protease activity HflC (stomatin/prohibitin superfamily)
MTTGTTSCERWPVTAGALLPPLRPGSIVIGLAGVLLLILLLSSWYTVQPEQTAVIQRFGRVVRYGRDPEFYAFSRTLEAYRDGQNGNAVLILTTDSDYYRSLKDTGGSGPAR